MSGYFERFFGAAGGAGGAALFGTGGFVAGGGGGFVVGGGPVAGWATAPAGAYVLGSAGAAYGGYEGYKAGSGLGAYVDSTSAGQYVNKKVDDFNEWLYADEKAQEEDITVSCSGECPPKKKERKDKDGNDQIPEDRKKHILDGDKSGGGHRAGTGKPGKTEFPSGWSDDDILDGIGEVGENGTVIGPAHRPGEVVKGGTVGGVDIEVVVKPNGGVRTGYPTGGAGVIRNPKP